MEEATPPVFGGGDDMAHQPQIVAFATSNSVVETAEFDHAVAMLFRVSFTHIVTGVFLLFTFWAMYVWPLIVAGLALVLGCVEFMRYRSVAHTLRSSCCCMPSTGVRQQVFINGVLVFLAILSAISGIAAAAVNGSPREAYFVFAILGSIASAFLAFVSVAGCYYAHKVDTICSEDPQWNSEGYIEAATVRTIRVAPATQTALNDVDQVTVGRVLHFGPGVDVAGQPHHTDGTNVIGGGGEEGIVVAADDVDGPRALRGRTLPQAQGYVPFFMMAQQQQPPGMAATTPPTTTPLRATNDATTGGGGGGATTPPPATMAVPFHQQAPEEVGGAAATTPLGRPAQPNGNVANPLTPHGAVN